MRRTKKWLLVAALLITAVGRSQRLPMVNYTLRYPALGNGVLQVFQDSKGWMWFATGTHILRYNGAEVFELIPAHGVAVDFCYQVLEVAGKLRVNSEPYNLWADGDSLRRLPANEDKERVDASMQMNGNEYRLNRNGLTLSNGKQTEKLIAANFSKSPGHHLFSFRDSLLLGHLMQDSLLVFNLKRRTLYRYAAKVFDLALAPGNKLLFLTNDGLHQVNEISFQPGKIIIADTILYASPLTNASRVNTDEAGNIWLSIHQQRLVKLSGNYSKIYNTSDGLPGLSVTDIFRDREDNIWLSLSNGVLKISPEKAFHYTAADGLAFNVAENMLAQNNNGPVFACTLHGLCMYYGNNWIKLKYQDSAFTCQQIVPLENDYACYALDKVYRVHIDFDKGIISKKTLLAALPQPANCIVSDRYNNVYVADHHGVWFISKGKISRLPLPDSSFKTLYIDSRNRLWCGQFGGPLNGLQIHFSEPAASFTPIPWKANNIPKQLLAVRCIAEDKQGRIIAGTRFNGLYQLQITNDTLTGWTQLTVKDGLPSNTIWDMTIDDQNRYWLVNDGITVVSNNDEKKQVRRTGKLYGIRRAYKIALQPPGKMWVATPEGIVAFNPYETAPVHNSVYTTRITGVWINEKKQPAFNQSSISLSHRENNLMIQFSVNSFRQEELISYSYSFAGNGTLHWSKPVTENSVRLSAVSPGHYTFHVKAFDSFGNAIGDEATLTIKILPPFYLRWWFVVLCILMIVTAAYMIYRYRVQQLKKLMAVRNVISQNLHDDIGASLTNVLLLNEMARKNAGNAAASLPLLQRATEDLKRMGESLGDIVWNINPNNDQLPNVLAKMQRYAGEMLEGANIKAGLSFPDELPNEKMNMDQRRDLYLVFKELVHNVTKHANATEASVQLHVEDRIIRLRIADNGTGFDLNNGIRLNGLNNIKERVAKWKGSLDVDSSPGGGTIISISMPLRQ